MQSFGNTAENHIGEHPFQNLHSSGKKINNTTCFSKTEPSRYVSEGKQKQASKGIETSIRVEGASPRRKLRGSSLVSVVVRHVSELMTLGQSFYQCAPEVRCSFLTELQSTVCAAGQREAFIYHLASWNNHDKIELPGSLPFHGAETFHSACAAV